LALVLTFLPLVLLLSSYKKCGQGLKPSTIFLGAAIFDSLLQRDLNSILKPHNCNIFPNRKLVIYYSKYSIYASMCRYSDEKLRIFHIRIIFQSFKAICIITTPKALKTRAVL
ncbi:MAG: hypothetical protein QXT54_04880, partial [Thermoplasmatales archaeon]